MKKVISIMLVFSMLLSFASVSLAAEPTSNVLEDTSIVNVTGQLEEGGDYVNVLLLDSSNNVKYINEFPVEADGSYRAKFKYDGDIAGLSLQVKQGLSDKTGSVVSAITEDEAIVYTLDVVNSPVNSEVKAQIENYYNVTGKTYKVILAYYGENNRLLDVVMENTQNIGDDLTIHQEDYKIPDDAKKIKVFMWNNEKTMLPLVESVEGKRNDTIRLLAIGNSHTADALEYLDDIAANNGDNIIFRHAMINGGTYRSHWNAISNKNASYKEGGVSRTLDDFLDDGTKYDYIVIGQTIGFSESNEYFVTDGDNLLKYIREKQPTAELVLHATWAYEKGSPDAKFNELYDGNQQEMYEAMKERNEYACEYFADLSTDSGKPLSLNGEPLRYIPSIDAFKIAGEYDIFDTTHSGDIIPDQGWPMPWPSDENSLFRDSYHAGYRTGRYLVALTWYACLTGKSVLNDNWSDVDESRSIYPGTREIINQSAQEAVDNYDRWPKTE